MVIGDNTEEVKLKMEDESTEQVRTFHYLRWNCPEHIFI